MEQSEEYLQKADRLRCITQRIGFALWQLQELEACSAEYFVITVQAYKGMGTTAGRSLLEKAKGKTFGATIQEMKKAEILSNDLAERLTNILSERNWLVHRSRDEGQGAVHDNLNLERVIARVDNIAEESLSILKEIGSMVEAHAMKHGISKSQIDEEAKKLLAEWQKSEKI